MSIRLATFNTENLFARYNFNKNYNPVSKDGFTINDLAFDVYDEKRHDINEASSPASSGKSFTPSPPSADSARS